MSSISSLALTSKISSIIFVMMEGSLNNENRETGCNMLMRCSMGFSGYGSHLNRDILIGKYRSNTIYIVIPYTHCVWRILLGILVGYFRYLMKRKFRKGRGERGHVISECKKY